MQISKWVPIAIALMVFAACFFPWITVSSLGVSIGGFEATVKDYGKPGVLHAFFLGVCILFLLIQRTWSVRSAFFVSAANIAWAARNFFLISACQGGICPQKQPALYVLLFGSMLFTVSILGVRPRTKPQGSSV